MMRENLAPRAGINPRALLRKKGTSFADPRPGNRTLNRNPLVDAMSMERPIGINRRRVVLPFGGKPCRHSKEFVVLLPEGRRLR